MGPIEISVLIVGLGLVAVLFFYRRPVAVTHPPAPDESFKANVRCPECGSFGPHAALLVLYAYEIRRLLDGRSMLVESVQGKRLGCQRCPCVFSQDMDGTFRHHRESLPLTAEPRQLVEELLRHAQQGQTNDAKTPPGFLIPPARQRPPM